MSHETATMMPDEITAPKSLKIFGVVMIVLGGLCLLAPLIVGELIAVLVGVLVLIAGIVRIVWSFQSRTFGQGALRLLLGGLTLICGLMMVSSPVFAASVLTLLLVFYFILEGITELYAAFQMRSKTGRNWMILDGILSLILGYMIWSDYPFSGGWAIGILLGIKLIFMGVVVLAAGNRAEPLHAEVTARREL